MSEPEKLYTLPQVLEIVRGHATALDAAGKALDATEGTDPEVLAMVGERAQKAKEELWRFQSEDVIDEAAAAAWNLRAENGEHSPLWFSLWALPLLVMSVEAIANGQLPAEDQAHWLIFEAERISEVLMEWVTAQEKKIPIEYPTIEVDAAEIFGFSKATIEYRGEQPFPEGFDELSGSLGHLWLIRHDELHEYSGEGIWYLPESIEFDADLTSPFARLAADHSTLYPVSAEEVEPYISGFTPPQATPEKEATQS